MSPKKRTLSIIITVLLFLLISAVLIFLDTKKMNEYYDGTIEITYKDSINLKVDETWLNHGYLYFNDKYYLFDQRVSQPNLEFIQIIELKTPFYLKKSSYSDTLILQHNDKYYTLILKSKD
jgi:hypothetical protein